MKYASVVILDNNQDLVNAITNEISSLVANIKILNVSQNTPLNLFDINNTLFISQDKELLILQLSQLCTSNELAVLEKQSPNSIFTQSIFCAGKITTLVNFFKNHNTANESLEYQTDCLIDKIFSTLGIRRNLLGALYLNSAIKLAVSDPFLIMHGITTKLYPNIAKTYDTTPTKVERSIRHTLESCFNYGKFTSLNELFQAPLYSPLDKPSNGEFIALMADKITLKLHNQRYVGGY